MDKQTDGQTDRVCRSKKEIITEREIIYNKLTTQDLTKNGKKSQQKERR